MLRRVPTHLPNYVKPDGTISSLAFRGKKDDDGLSVDLSRLSSFNQATLGNKNYRLLSVSVDTIRNEINEGLDVVHNPIEDNYAHSLITGNITKSKQKKLILHSIEVTE